MMGIYHSITPIIEIIILGVLLNYLLSFFWNTRSMDLLLGLLAFFLLFAISSWLQLPILHYLALLGANVTVIAILIIFQPELRTALSKFSWKGRRYKAVTEFDTFLDQLSNSIYRMAERRAGAIICLENDDSLEEFAKRSVMLNALFSPELLESIFMEATPLHDGAVIVSNSLIVAAAVILPLAEESIKINRTMGTRHRAALGISQIVDTLVIVISEETGKVSIARDGIMTQGIKIDRLKGIIRSIFNPPEQIQKKFLLLSWLKK